MQTLLKSILKFLAWWLGPLGAVLLTALASATGVQAFCINILKPLADAGYKWLKKVPFGDKVITFIDLSAEWFSNYWPPKDT